MDNGKCPECEASGTIIVKEELRNGEEVHHCTNCEVYYCTNRMNKRREQEVAT